jgi:DUF1009 family protein
MPSPSAPPEGASPLAIVCGAGQFPLAVAEAVTAAGRPVFLVGVRGAADRDIGRYPHEWVGMGRAGRMLKAVRGAGAKDITFVGAVPRPAFSLDFIPDFRFLKVAFRVLGSGDNTMLSLLADEIAREGLTLRGVHEVAPGLILPAGPLGRHLPSSEALAAARFGLDVLDALSPYDVGQGMVVADRRVVAVEAAEGTDLMLARVAELCASGRLRMAPGRSVFVKAAKRGQELRLDTPAVGVETVARAKAAGLAGIAIAAGEVMAPDMAALISAADDAGLFVVGLERSA